MLPVGNVLIKATSNQLFRAGQPWPAYATYLKGLDGIASGTVIFHNGLLGRVDQ
jgi:hypothetical protein